LNSLVLIITKERGNHETTRIKMDDFSHGDRFN
jgi:hypothetical protein